MPDSIIACMVAAAAIEEEPSPRCCIIAVTLRTAGEAHTGGGLPSSIPLNNSSS